jgi:hypothetical protein
MSKDLKKLIKDNGATVLQLLYPGYKEEYSAKHTKKLKNSQKIQRS